jgi:hypothetical protein
VSREFLFDASFALYRQEEMKVAVEFIESFLNGSSSPEYLKGAMDALRKVIKLPGSLARNNEEKEVAKTLHEAAWKEVESRLFRSVVEREE